MSCAECSGHGTLFVLPAYVDQQAPLPAEPELAMMTPADLLVILANRAALANTVYPCPGCRPDQFAAWSSGTFVTAPLGVRSSVPAKARRSTPKADPLPMQEPTWLDPADWTMTRKDLE